ncbi:MAG: alpha/beta hydrolase [Lachnospiraceae bacterium]|nr:alpha/beta hydrolase [Lachnospiraceae bacterium]
MDGLSLLKKMNQDATMYASSMQMEEQKLQEHQAELNSMDPQNEEVRLIQQKLIEQLMVDTQSAEDLMTKYPALVLKAQREEARLSEDASRSGKEKREQDRFATKKVSAKWKLWRMESRRSKLEEKRYGKELKVEQRSGSMHDFVLGQFNGQEEDTIDSKGQVKEKGRRTKVMDTFFTTIYGNPEFEEEDTVVVSPHVRGMLPVQRKKVSFAGGDLKGSCFEPADYDQQSGKVLIYYTGSGQPGSAEEGVGETIQSYLKQGFKVYQVDYRGYGESAEGKQVAFSEAGFYNDGMEIYRSVLADTGCSPSQIVMHGYSMGGAVASYVAGKVAQESAKQHHGKENVPPDEKLGGLVLDSPMASLAKASKGSTGGIRGSAEGLLGSLAAGKYSAEDHLGTLFQNQPDIPIMFVGGGDADHLSLAKTEIDRKYPFQSADSQVLSFTRAAGHEAAHMTDDNLQAFMTKYQMAGPKTLSDEDLTRLRTEARQRRVQRAQAGQQSQQPPQADH